MHHVPLTCAMHPRIKLVSRPKAQTMVVPAYTIKGHAGDNLVFHAALNFCTGGDVLVVSNEEDDTCALMCEIMVTYIALLKYRVFFSVFTFMQHDRTVAKYLPYTNKQPRIRADIRHR